MSYFRAATFYGKYWTKTSDALQTNVKRDLSDEFYSRHSLRCMTLPEALCFYSQFQRSFIMLDKRDKSTHYAINIFTKPNISVEDPTLSWSPGIMYALHQATWPAWMAKPLNEPAVPALVYIRGNLELNRTDPLKPRCS